MKSSPQSTAVLAGDDNAATGVSKFTGGKSPLSSETLLLLGSLHAAKDVDAMLAADESSAASARGVQAGLVAALHAILPADQFRAVMIQWEVDAIKLSELLHIAGANNTETNEAIEA